MPKEEIETVKDSWLWIKNDKGKGSVTVTFVTVAFFVTTISYVMSMFESIGPFSMRPFDVAACASYLTPLLTLYAGRRFTDAKYPTKEE